MTPQTAARRSIRDGAYPIFNFRDLFYYFERPSFLLFILLPRDARSASAVIKRRQSRDHWTPDMLFPTRGPLKNRRSILHSC